MLLEGSEGGGEDITDEGERDELNDFRAQLLRQFGGEESSPTPSPDTEDAPTIAQKLAPGQLLVAHPQRFCSSNPFARPVKDISRFGLQGPVTGPGLSPDVKAQMLPVRLYPPLSPFSAWFPVWRGRTLISSLRKRSREGEEEGI